MKRILWIDNAKALGIFLVILAHTQINGSVTDWISVFRMPLFFFISGYLFSFERNPSIKEFIKKRFHQIVIPYIIINVITYFFWLFIGRNYGISGNEDSIAWYSPIIAMLLCDGKNMVHDIPLWFLLCLFIVEVVYHFLYKTRTRIQRWLITFTFGIMGYINYKFVPIVLPFSLGTAFVGMMFYFLGNEIALYKRKYKTPSLLQFLLLIVSLCIVTYFSIINERVYLYCNHYGNYLYFILAALSGIYMMFALSDYISKVFGNNSIIRYISNNTLVICGFHLMIYTLLKGIAVYIFSMPLDIFYGTVLPNVLLTTVGLVCCCLLAYLFNKYYPIVLGK